MSEIVPIVVSKLGRGHYTTITEALHAAPLGALIQVEAGVYRESVVLDKPVEIAGMGRAEDTVIESTDAPCLTVQTDQAVVRNLSLRLQPQPETAISTEQGHYGVDIPMGQLTLLDCWVTSRSWSCIGIHGEAADPIIRRCTLHHSSQAGLLVKEGGRGHIEDCIIIGNQVAVEVRQGSRPSLRGCTIREHAQHGVYIHTDAEAALESCEISECENGVFLSEKGNALLHHCRIHDARDDGVWISEATATLEDCEIGGCANIGVRVGGEGASATLHRCTLQKCKLGVLAGRGGVARLDRCRLVDGAAGLGVVAKGMASLARCTVHGIVAGTTDIPGGDVTLEGCDITGVKGASAITAYAGSKLALHDCTIHDSEGHGIHLYAAQATVERCENRRHRYQGVRVEEGGSIIVRGGQIHHCQLALSINNKSQAIVEDCTLTHNGHASEESESNTYAQVWAGHESEATLRRCTIRDGARDSIGLRYQSTGTVEECAIEGNARDGLWIGEQTRATIRRCRINRHKHNAITIKKDCTVVVEDCDLSGNERGAWDLPLFGVRGLRRERNEE